MTVSLADSAVCVSLCRDGAHQRFLWENADGRGQTWREHKLQSGLQMHESVAADVDGDGDIDMRTKPQSGDLHFCLSKVA